jgi:hypothetical protein
MLVIKRLRTAPVPVSDLLTFEVLTFQTSDVERREGQLTLKEADGRLSIRLLNSPLGEFDHVNQLSWQVGISRR